MTQHAPESGRYYTREGKIITEVKCSTTTGTRAPTVRDAKKHGWYPSWSAVKNDMHNHFLEEYKMRQLLEIALASDTKEEVSDDVFRAFKRDSESGARLAADTGSDIHRDINAYFEHGVTPSSPITKNTCKQLGELYTRMGFGCVRNDGFHHFNEMGCEKVFVSADLGLAGTMDGAFTKTIIDYKTREKPNVYPTDGMQLASYALATNPDADLINVIISRATGDILKVQSWHEKKAQLTRDFLYLFGLFCSRRNFWPGKRSVLSYLVGLEEGSS